VRKRETHSKPVEDALFLHYAPRNRLVVLTGSQDPERALRDGYQLRIHDLDARYRETATHFPFVMSAVAASEDGRHLAWITHDERHSPGEITLWDVERWQEAGRLEWDPEDPLRDLAFSPDGHTLVTGSSAGVVKFWPWRLLLEG
jgi:hypothetical protein